MVITLELTAESLGHIERKSMGFADLICELEAEQLRDAAKLRLAREFKVEVLRVETDES